MEIRELYNNAGLLGSLYLGAVHKKGLHSWGVCSVRTFFGQMVFFRCGRLQFLEQKPSDFSKFNGVSARTQQKEV